MSNDNDLDAVCRAWGTLDRELLGWLDGEHRRETVANEIRWREGLLGEREYLQGLEAPEPWQQERLRLLDHGADYDRSRVDELRAEQRRHEEMTARIWEAEGILFGFADQHGIDAEPLLALVAEKWEEVQTIKVVSVLRRVKGALDRLQAEATAAAGDAARQEPAPAGADAPPAGPAAMAEPGGDGAEPPAEEVPEVPGPGKVAAGGSEVESAPPQPGADVPLVPLAATAAMGGGGGGPSAEEVPPEEGVAGASEGETEEIELVDGGFALRGKFCPLAGRPLTMLRVLVDSPHRSAKADRLREEMGVNDEKVEYPEQVIRDTAKILRKALKKAGGLSRKKNPLPHSGRGEDLAYRLNLP
jgi:hypothetical protein